MRTEPRGFYHALAALLFAAVCAWLGAAVFGGLGQAAAAAEEAPDESGSFRGVLLRREIVLAPEEIPASAESGKRLSATDSGHGAGLFFRDTDGLERLSPADAENLTPERLDALFAEKPEKAEGAGRLVQDFACCCAAFYEGAAAPETGPCRLRLDGGGEFEGSVVSAFTDEEGRTALLIRLTEGGAELYRLRFVTGEVTMGA